MRREARVRPEYAHLYPMLDPEQWQSAAAIAERVAASRLLQLADTFVLHDRVLADAHFEFRGGASSRSDSKSRSETAGSGPDLPRLTRGLAP
jgi:hypothetical protein